MALDVTDPDAATAAVGAGAAAFGRIDVVVNNAGYANLASVEDMTLADFRAQVDANLFGVVNVTKAALPLLREQGGGHIIQVSSIGGRLGDARPVGLPGVQVGGRWLFRSPGAGSQPVRYQGHRPGTRRHADRLGRVLHAGAADQRAVPADRRRDGRAAPRPGQRDALGDPAKVARVVLDVAGMDEPPLRLILGSEAYAYAMAAARERAEADAARHDLTVSTDRDDATAADRDPLGAASSA